jgi:hypothetical protein
MEIVMATVAHQKQIKLSSNTISDIITTGISIIQKGYSCCNNYSNSDTDDLSLSQMSDIIFLDKVSGATLVYDAFLDKFILETIPSINAGSF